MQKLCWLYQASISTMLIVLPSLVGHTATLNAASNSTRHSYSNQSTLNCGAVPDQTSSFETLMDNIVDESVFGYARVERWEAVEVRGLANTDSQQQK